MSYDIIPVSEPRHVPSPMRAAPLVLAKHISVESAMQEIFRNCLQQVEGNEDGVMTSLEPEPVHQMRVGLRRLRSALRIFSDLAPFPSELQEGLKWLGSVLGEARDWEVLALTTLPRVLREHGERVVPPALRELVVQTAAEKHAAAAQVLQSERYRNLMTGLHSWLDKREWRIAADPKQTKRLEERVERFARRVETHAHRRLVKGGRGLGAADAASLHKIRISAKRTRYATEYFKSLYRPKAARHYLAGLAALQDELGVRNDESVARALLTQLCANHPALKNEAESVGRLLSESKGKHRLKKTWKTFRSMRKPW